jgi:hypothetical protein
MEELFIQFTGKDFRFSNLKECLIENKILNENQISGMKYDDIFFLVFLNFIEFC